MITFLLFATLFGAFVVWTGPACDDVRARRAYRLDFPNARAKLLPPPPAECALCGRKHKLLEN